MKQKYKKFRRKQEDSPKLPVKNLSHQRKLPLKENLFPLCYHLTSKVKKKP